MAELGQGEKRLYIENSSANAYQPEYVTDSDEASTSAKEVYFRWLSRLVVLCAVLSLVFVRNIGYFSFGTGNYC